MRSLALALVLFACSASEDHAAVMQKVEVRALLLRFELQSPAMARELELDRDRARRIDIFVPPPATSREHHEQPSAL